MENEKELSPEEQKRLERFDAAYPFWRWDMWEKGYGTYEAIDRKVSEGELIPFKDYPALKSQAD